MRYAILVTTCLAIPALAQPPTALPCVDASRRSTYNAKPISRHEVLARNAMGIDGRSLRLGTTCIHIDRTAVVSLRSMTQCIAKGDDVTVVTIDGQLETCRVGSVTVGNDYARAKYE